MQWIEFAATEPAPSAAVARLESALQRRSYVAGHAFSLADALALALVVEALSPADSLTKRPSLSRWVDQVLHEPAGVGAEVAAAALPAGSAAPAVPARAPLRLNFAAAASGGKKDAAAAAGGKKEAKAGSGPAGAGGGGAGAGPAPPAPEASAIAECDFRVGRIVDVWKHPSSDKLYCEKIDLGEPTGPREIASGLVPYFTLEQMQNRRVVVVANLKPRPLAGFVSNGMVLCATSADGKVEFVTPPEGAKVGERVAFEGHSAPAAEPNRMAKKKIFEAAAPDLVVDDQLRAAWKGVPFMTTAGPCVVESAKGGLIQ